MREPGFHRVVLAELHLGCNCTDTLCGRLHRRSMEANRTRGSDMTNRPVNPDARASAVLCMSAGARRLLGTLGRLNVFM